MLRASHDTGILDTLDTLANGNTRQIRIRGEAFPIPSSLWGTAEGTGNGAEDDVDALSFVFLAYGLAATVHQAPIEGSSHGLAGAEGRGKLAKADTERRVLHAELAEAKSRHTSCLANTLSSCPTVTTNG